MSPKRDISGAGTRGGGIRPGRPAGTFIVRDVVPGHVDDRTRQDDRGPSGSTQDDELRTIAFRLREIQRLLGARVKQENRRLEADGIEPVTDHDFYRPEGERADADDADR